MHSQILERLNSRKATVGILGLGYVGLPLALVFGEKGCRILGFDVDEAKVAALQRGEGYIRHLDHGRIAALTASGHFEATADFARLVEPDALLICVPTPLTAQREPDLSYVIRTAEQIAATLRPGQLVVLESTTYPGTTDELVRGILDRSGLVLGRDYFLAFSPEREDPGNPTYGTANIPKVVGGVDPASGDLAEALYASVLPKVVRVSHARVAEATKLVENIFRAVNIALVNELKIVYDRMGIDIWEVLDAAATKPFGFMRFHPGPGLGGHCLAGQEWVRLRTPAGQEICRLGDLADRLKRDGTEAAATREGIFFRPQGLEALSFDAASGDLGWCPVDAVYRGRFEGDLLEIETHDHRLLRVTPGHPMVVERSAELQVLPASELRAGDRLPVASDLGDEGTLPEVDLLDAVPPGKRETVWVRVAGRSWAEWSGLLKQRFGWTIRDSIRKDSLRLDRFLEVEPALGIDRSQLQLLTGRGTARRQWPVRLALTPDWARFVGYFLAEGCISNSGNTQSVRLTFHRNETGLIEDVQEILARHGFPTSQYHDKTWRTTTIKASSQPLAWLLDQVWKCGRGSKEMKIPPVLMGAGPDHKRELLSGLLRGDGDSEGHVGSRTYTKNGKTYTHHDAKALVGYFSSSSVLAQQVLHLLQDLGFRPRLKSSDGKQIRIQGAEQIAALAPLLFGEKCQRLERAQAGRRRDAPGRHAHRPLAPSLFTAEVRSLRQVPSDGWVYSLEIPGPETFTASHGIVVHNCIPLDPFYLSWKAREFGVAPKFIELAGEINAAMPEYVVGKLATALNRQGKAVKGSQVLVLGLAYKKDIDDPRESPAFEVIEKLLHLEAQVSYHDPHIPAAPAMRTWPNLPALRSVALDAPTLAAQDAVMIITDHTAVDYNLVARCAALVIDTRGVYRTPRPNVVKA